MLNYHHAIMVFKFFFALGLIREEKTVKKSKAWTTLFFSE